MSFLSEYGSVIIFYAAVAVLIYLFRKKFEFQGKIIALLKTQLGVKLMHKWGERAGKPIRAIGTIGIYVGFAGMVFATFIILQGLWTLFFTPEAPPTISPVIPGVKIPGAAIFVPFWYGIIALFIVIAVHEFSHGVVAQAHKIKIKSSGVGMMGPLPLAFVEPDEKQMSKARPHAQLSILAAGPWSNIILALLLTWLFGLIPVFTSGIDATYGTHATSEGLWKVNEKISLVNYADFRAKALIPEGYIINTQPGYPASQAGIPNETVITIINGVDGNENFTRFDQEISRLTPSQTISLGNETHTWNLTTATNPDNESKGYLGVYITGVAGKENEAFKEEQGDFLFSLNKILYQQVLWIILLSLGIGITNLLPLGPVDGGKMLLVILERTFPKKKALHIWTQAAWFLLLAIIILLFIPILRALGVGFI